MSEDEAREERRFKLAVEAIDTDSLKDATVASLTVTGDRDKIIDLAEVVVIALGLEVYSATAYSGGEEQDITSEFVRPPIEMIDPLDTGDPAVEA